MGSSIAKEDNASSLRYLKGIGPKRAETLARIGILSVFDLLLYFPRRYEDRSKVYPIANIQAGETVTVRGEVLKTTFKPIRRMPIVELLIGDDTGTISALWFNQPYLQNQFQAGQQIVLFGKAEIYKNRLQLSSPEYEITDETDDQTHTGRIIPVYPLTEGLFQRSFRQILKQTVETQLETHITEFLPEHFLAEHGLMGLKEAIPEMHFPTTFEALEKARRRIVFDEFFIFEIALLKKMEAVKTKHTAPVLNSLNLPQSFYTRLPFMPTKDQLTVIEEICADMSQPIPMNRLLQGEVGSGKTIVAGLALFVAASNLAQAALLVPTEILAEQHFRSLAPLLEPLGVNINILTASTPGPKRDKILSDIKTGRLHVLIGTHAILQEDLKYKNLSLLVVDEQHKFGVYQRNKLLNTNPRPHQLVMTATPIPRTLALTLYGDLKVSTIKEMPKGRQPIKTYWITRKKQSLVLDHILEKIKQGEQAYIIFPLIEETEKSDLLAATQEFEKLKKGSFAGVKMGLVHGRISSEQRDEIMRSFRAGDTKVLVATSVIEVGVDNPNATMMIIENAERFGLSQLHQMRGRIGRGKKPSECFLFGEPTTEEGKKRLRILTKSTNGFEIAEEDLTLRGPGDFWGTRQSGEPLFKVANPLTDFPILEEARNIALHLVKNHLIDTPEWQGIRSFIEKRALRY